MSTPSTCCGHAHSPSDHAGHRHAPCPSVSTPGARTSRWSAPLAVCSALKGTPRVPHGTPGYSGVLRGTPGNSGVVSVMQGCCVSRRMRQPLPTQSPAGAARCDALFPRHVPSCCRWGRPNAQSFLRVLAPSLTVLAVANPTSVPAGIPHTNKHTECRTHACTYTARGLNLTRSPSASTPAHARTQPRWASGCALRAPHVSAQSTSVRARVRNPSAKGASREYSGYPT